MQDSQYLSDQYRNATNLDARIQLHQRFSANKYGWMRWVFDQLQLPEQCHILELGCGTGELWSENLGRVPERWEILLTDFTEGMLLDAEQKLKGNPQFKYEIVDAGSLPLPFESYSFDAVIANHMLFHITDKPGLFAEILRVLKPGGRFYASTVGENHLVEIVKMISRFDSGLADWGNVTDAFTLENGAAQLSPWFNEVALHRYQDALLVTEVEPLLDYILSGWISLEADDLIRFKACVESEMESGGGVIRITKDSGIFESIRI